MPERRAIFDFRMIVWPDIALSTRSGSGVGVQPLVRCRMRLLLCFRAFEVNGHFMIGHMCISCLQ